MGNEKVKNKEWKNIFSIFMGNRKNIMKLVMDEEMRTRMQFFAVFIIFGVISLGMTAMNIVTEWHLLGWGTFVFGILNILNAVFCLICYRTEHMARALFGLEILFTFTYFIIIGEPEGFSVIWVALLPACGMLLYGMKYGTLLSLIQFAVLIFFFWIPAGNDLLMYEYTTSFCERFPLLYMAFLFVGIFFEGVVIITQKELLETKDNFEYQSIHDPLTGILNRGGFNRTVDEFLTENKGKSYAFAISDLDRFKEVNDTYGHQNGDHVLKYIADRLTEMVGENGTVCRWGGEEFAIFFRHGTDAEAMCQAMRADIKTKTFYFKDGECNVALSTGLVIVPETYKGKISNVITKADSNLYYAKEHGRDQVRISTMEM